jgi:sigma-B regulation protein RsbU (phosphoserine phosphatase)
MHRDGSHERLTEGGLVLGVFANQKFHGSTVQLRSGDRVVMYTDGVTEACNAQDEEFGEERLLSVLQEGPSRSAAEIQKSILQSVSEFSRGPWRDDATLLVVAVA